ncbi:MAG: pro-sigmaK processing inhibitor BofA family protein [Clostridia bacterium]|nr:pro-sigmaK processing inhibitor BofA family protein [Clostridia bacterium]
MYLQILINVIIIVYVLVISILFAKNKCFFKGLSINSLLGLVILFALKLFENILSVKIYINSITVALAILFGPLGVVFNMIINFFIKMSFF